MLMFTTSIKDKYGNFIDVDVWKEGDELTVKLDPHHGEIDYYFGATEVDKLINALQRAKEMLSND